MEFSIQDNPKVVRHYKLRSDEVIGEFTECIDSRGPHSTWSGSSRRGKQVGNECGSIVYRNPIPLPKGHRFLEAGELPEEGDLCFGLMKREWQEAKNFTIEVGKGIIVAYCRKIVEPVTHTAEICWISDRIPTEDDCSGDGFVIKALGDKDEWGLNQHYEVKLGDLWAPLSWISSLHRPPKSKTPAMDALINHLQATCVLVSTLDLLEAAITEKEAQGDD